MRFILTLFLFGIVLLTANGFKLMRNVNELKAVNGGVPCATCSVIVSLTEQLALVYNQTVDKSLERLCSYLPSGIFRTACQAAIDEFGPTIISGLYAKESADVICHQLGICRTDPGQPECHLYPIKNKQQHMSIAQRVIQFRANLLSQNVRIRRVASSSICDDAIFKPICDYIKRIFDKHEPAEDLDSDGFSVYPVN